MSDQEFGRDPFGGASGMDAYVHALNRYGDGSSAVAVERIPLPLAEEELIPEPGSFQRAPGRAFVEERTFPTPERPMPILRPAQNPDGSINLAGLWDRGKRALELDKIASPDRLPWVESPEPPLEPDYKLFPTKRRTRTETTLERLGRRLGIIPQSFTPAIDNFGQDMGYEAAVAPLFDFLYRKWFRVDTFGLSNVPSEGRVLLVSNHANWMVFDAAMIKVAVQLKHDARREVRALVDRFAPSMPWLNTFMSRTGQVLGCPENALKLLERDEVVLTFPEGARGALKPYRERPRVGRFSRGFARLAILTRTPIIPVAVQGFEELHPVLFSLKGLGKKLGFPGLPITPTFPLLGLLGLVPPPVKCFIEFGSPLSTEDFGPHAADDEEIVSRLSVKVRLIIQDLYEHLRVQRPSLLAR